jgi:hypothetical protein
VALQANLDSGTCALQVLIRKIALRMRAVRGARDESDDTKIQ